MEAAQNIRRGLLPVALTVILAVPLSVAAQEEAPPPPVYGMGLQFSTLANMPIAGMLDRGHYEIDMRMYPEGGLYSFVTIGFLHGVNIGFSFGAENVIGRGKVDWNPNVEFAFKARLIPESTLLPALAIGYAGQGFGPHLSDPDPLINLDRYAVKSPGFYLVLSKNYRVLTEIGLHFGLNRSRETDDDDDLNMFLGLDMALGSYLYLIAEYDAALNDNGDESLGDGNGYLNLGVKWAASPHLRLEIYFTNLLDNVAGMDKSATIENIAGTIGGAGREFRVVYLDWF